MTFPLGGLSNIATLNGVNVGGSANASYIDNNVAPNGAYTYTGPKVANDYLDAAFIGSSGASGFMGTMYGDSTYLSSLTCNNSNFGIFGSNTSSTNYNHNPCKYSPKLD